MTIRYFATNRSMDRLAQVLKRERRLRVEDGGYYFVNMEKYMAYYFGEVEPGVMPYEAIVKNSRRIVFDDFLADPRIGRVVVCVHGFNVHFHEAFTWFRVLSDTMSHLPECENKMVTNPEDLARLKNAQDGELTAFIGFSWPSNGSVLSYPSDQRDAAASGPALANLLGRIHLRNKSVNLICHSMGNYLACQMLAGLVKKNFIPSAFQIDAIKASLPKKTKAEYQQIADSMLSMLARSKLREDGSPKRRDRYFVDRFIMLAPDVERRHITKCDELGVSTDYVGPFYSGLQYLVDSIDNFYSRFDTALSISDFEKAPREIALAAASAASKLTFGLLDFMERNPDQKWEKRLGEAPHPPNGPQGFRSINATEVAGRKIDHSDHIDSEEIATRVAAVLGFKEGTA